MTGIKRVVLASTMLLFLLQLVSIFLDWVAITFDETKYVTSMWSDSAADVKYVIIVIAVLGIISALVGTLLQENQTWFNGGILIMALVNGGIGLFYYLNEQNDVSELQDAGIEVEFSTEFGFYVFLIVIVLSLIASILGFVLPEEE